MRTMTVTCDVCKKTVDDFNGGVTLAAGWGETIRTDACSVKCIIVILSGLSVQLVARGDKVAADNAAFEKDNPEATLTGNVAVNVPGEDVPEPVGEATFTDPHGTPIALIEPNVPVPLESQPALTGCAACDAGTEFNKETAFKHTGEGALCQGKSPTATEAGPCSCTPDNWKIEHPPEVTCLKCGNCWTAKLTTAGKGGKGRPKGSKNKKTLEAEAAAAATAKNGTRPAIPAETPENKAARDVALGRTPDASHDELERLKASRATNGTVPVNSSAPLPGENFSQLLTDAVKLGVTLNLVDVMKWTSMQRDLLRAWVANPEYDPPFFLAEMGYGPVKTASVPQVPVPVPAIVEPPVVTPATPRFTF